MSTFKELLAKVTPGKWASPSLWDITGMAKNRIVHDCRPGETWKKDTADICYFPPDIQNAANAQYIARLNPETMALVFEALELVENHFVVERDGITGKTVLRVTECPPTLECIQPVSDALAALNALNK